MPTLMWFSAIFIYNHNIVVVGQIRGGGGGGGGDGEKKFRTTFAVATDRREMIKVSGDPPTDHRAPVTTTSADDEWVEECSTRCAAPVHGVIIGRRPRGEMLISMLNNMTTDEKEQLKANC